MWWPAAASAVGAARFAVHRLRTGVLRNGSLGYSDANMGKRSMHLGHGLSRDRRNLVTPDSWQGFTLIELMITIGVLAVLVMLAIPSFTTVINNNRLAANANELIASLQLARTEAVRRNTRITVCRT